MDDSRAVPSLSIAEAEDFFSTGIDARSIAAGLEPATLSALRGDIPCASGSPTRSGRASAAGTDLEPDRTGSGVPCCTGVDLPEAGGRVHADTCQLAGQRFVAAMDMAPVADRVASLLCQLLFAARDLAQAQIEPSLGPDPAFCTECTVDEQDGSIAHEPICRVGRVLQVIAEICNPPSDFLLQRKEAAPAAEGRGRAGDGIHSRGLEAASSVSPSAGGAR